MISAISTRRLAVLAAAGVLAGGLAAATVAAASDGEISTRTVIGHGLSRLPSQHAQDWATYGDHLAVITVRSERDRPVPSDNPGSGYIGRVVTAAVTKTLWSRSGASAAPRSVEFVAPGWTLKEGNRTEFALGGGPRIEVGETYVAALVRLADGAWTPLAADAVIPYRDGVLGRGEQKGGVHENSLRKEMDGKSAEDLAAKLKATPPDPAAAGLSSTDPEKRHMDAMKRKAAAGL